MADELKNTIVGSHDSRPLEAELEASAAEFDAGEYEDAHAFALRPCACTAKPQSR